MADNDVLLYFPVFDRYADYGKGMLEHFDAISPAFNGTPFRAAVEMMITKGFGFDYVSDLQLKNTIPYEGLLQTEGNVYGTLIVPGCKFIPVETFTQILRLANNGAKIIFYGDLPENISGWADKDEKTLFFEKLKTGISFNATNNPEVLKAVYGKGMILNGSDLEQLLTFAGIPRETMTDDKLAYARRQTPAGTVYFITNQGEKEFDGWISLQAEAVSAAIFNPMDNKYGMAKTRPASGGGLDVYTRLKPFESVIINTYDVRPKGKPYMFYDPVSSPVDIKGTWKIDFTEGGPTLPASREVSGPGSWTNLEGDDFKSFSGTAKYSVSFSKPSGKADAWILNLGKVCESANITLNGKELGILIGPDYHITIDKKQLETKNTLEIKVSNLMANRIAYMDKNNIPWKKFYNVNMAARLKQNTKDGIFDASEWEPRESGLIGPVTITPVKIAK